MRFNLVVFCQALGPWFRQLIVDLSDQFGPTVLLTGSEGGQTYRNLVTQPSPRYSNRSVRSRLLTWSHYVLHALLYTCGLRGKPLVLAVTNPPFNLWLALALKLIRGWPYVLLIWDVYPDALVRFGYLSEGHIITRAWRWINRLAIRNAEQVITLGSVMAETVQRGQTDDGQRIRIIPNWIDSDWIKPIPKSANWFAAAHGQTDKCTVLYSGNMGATHNLITVLDAAERLRDENSISFLLIGDGAQRIPLEGAVAERGLTNVRILPRQPEEVLPYSLATGDIALVSLDRGAEGISMPSKTYSMMAAGCALIGLCHGENDLRGTIEAHQCGLILEPDDGVSLANAICTLSGNPDLLAAFRHNARAAATRYYARLICTDQFIEVLRSAMPALGASAGASAPAPETRQ